MGNLFYDRDGGLDPASGMRRRVDHRVHGLDFAIDTPYSAQALDLRNEIVVGAQYPAVWTAAGLTLEHQLPGAGAGTVTCAAVNVGDTVSVDVYWLDRSSDPVAAPLAELTFTAAAAEDLDAGEFNQAAGNDAAATSLAACMAASGVHDLVATAAAAVVGFAPAYSELVFSLRSSDAGRLAVVNPWRPCEDVEGDLVALTVTANQYRPLNPADTAGYACIRLLSGTSAVPVDQTAARTLSVVTRRRFES